jgi:hypothetical protein
MQKACFRELEEMPQQKPHVAPHTGAWIETIDGNWKAMDKNCLIEIKRVR